MAKKKSTSKTPKKAAAQAQAPRKKKSPAKAVKKSPAKKAKKVPVNAQSSAQSTGPKKVALLSTQKQKNISPWPIVLMIIGVAIIIAGLVFLLSPKDLAPEDIPPSQIAASVNGVPIMTDTLNRQYSMLPEDYKSVYTPELVLEQLVDEELIIQYGQEKGFTVTPAEVQAEVQGILSGDMTMADLEENLANFNMTFDDFELLISRKLMIERSINDIFTQAPTTTDAEIKAYYDDHISEFATQEQVTVRHILIASQRDNAAQFSKDLIDQIKGGADFCQLVVEETDDTGSKDTCGEYTFPRGVMVPEFETASFDMAPGDLTLVQTQFGYHIIEKLADIPAGQQSFDDVKEELRTTLDQEARSAYYSAWLAGQREQADIELFI